MTWTTVAPTILSKSPQWEHKFCSCFCFLRGACSTMKHQKWYKGGGGRIKTVCEIHIQADKQSLREDVHFYWRMLFHLNQYNVYTKRIAFHLSVCFYFQQSVLAALYSSEGSVMEVNSQPATSHPRDQGDLTMFSNSMRDLCLYNSLLHIHSVVTLLGAHAQSIAIQYSSSVINSTFTTFVMFIFCWHCRKCVNECLFMRS